MAASEIEKLERLVKENPKGRLFASLADAYRKDGQYPKALEVLDAGLKNHPEYVSARVVLGRVHLATGDRADGDGGGARRTRGGGDRGAGADRADRGTGINDPGLPRDQRRADGAADGRDPGRRDPLVAPLLQCGDGTARPAAGAAAALALERRSADRAGRRRRAADGRARTDLLRRGRRRPDGTDGRARSGGTDGGGGAAHRRGARVRAEQRGDRRRGRAAGLAPRSRDDLRCFAGRRRGDPRVASGVPARTGGGDRARRFVQQ